VSTPARSATRGSLLLLAYFGFISLGLPDGLIGVGWPSIREEFAVPTEAVGLILTVGTVGYLTSSVAAGFTIARLGVGWLLAGSTALTAMALTGYSLSPLLGLMVGLAFVLGLGSGAIDSGLNAYAASAFGPRHMNWLHAFFGLGVAIGPLIMTAVLQLGLSWRWGYGLVAAAQGMLALAFVATAKAWSSRRPGDPQPPASAGASAPAAAVRSRDTLVIPAVWFGVLAFAVYTAVEVAAGLWAYLLLTEGRGLGAAVAGVCVSAYWGSLFAGRVVLGVAAERVGSARMLTACITGMAVGGLLVALPAPAWVAVAGLMLVGFAAAPVFPLLTLTTADRVGAAHADRVIGMQIGAAALGGAAIPAGVGVLLSRVNVEVLGPSLLALSVLLLVLYLGPARRRTAAA
jgi:fucose permease